MSDVIFLEEELMKDYSDYIDLVHGIVNISEDSIQNIINLTELNMNIHKIKPRDVFRIIDRISNYRLHNLRLYYLLFEEFYKKYPIYLHNSLLKTESLRAIISKKHGFDWHMSDFAYKNSKIQDILEIYDKSSILHAIFFDDTKELEKFADSPDFDVDTSIEGNNLIDHCAFYGSIDCFRFLICNKANVTSKTLENACLGGDDEIIHFCEQKFLPNARCINNSVVAHHNNIANYLQSKYDLEYSWSKCTFSYNIEMFLTKLCSIKEINSPDNGGFIAFPSAARFCIPSLINLLINKGANIKSRDFNKLTALDHCCILDSLDICQILIDNKMDVEDTSIYKITPLTYCSANDSYEVAKFLIEQCHANVNARDVIGSTPLIYASEGNSVKAAQLLLENGASIDDEDEFSKTPLMACAQYDSVDVAKILIEKGAFIEKTDKFNQTVLMKCAMSDACKLTRLLIENRANIEAVDVNKYDALMISVDCDSKNVEKLLREYKNLYKIKVK